MRECLLSMMLLVSTALASFGQLAKVKSFDNDRWGYVDVKGNVVIDYRFRGCGPFSNEGLAPVYMPGANPHYFIDKEGKKVPYELSFQLNNVITPGAKEGFVDGLTQVKINGRWGFMNPKGQLVIPAKYSKCTTFSDGYAIAKANGIVVVLDSIGNEIPIQLKEVVRGYEFSEGLAAIRAGKLYGYANTKGEVVIKPQFKGVGHFSEGLSFAINDSGLVGFLDRSGSWVIEPQFTEVRNFQSGFARVRLGEEWMFIDARGNRRPMKNYEAFGSFSEGLCFGVLDGKVGFLNTDFEWAVEPKYDKARGFHLGYCAVELDGKWGFIDREGKMVIDPKFKEAHDFSGRN